MSEPTFTARIRRSRPALLAAAAFLVPAGIGIAVGATLLSSAPSAAPAPTPSTTLSGAPSATPVAQEPIEFSSTSGNLRCRIDDDSAWCHQGEFVYYPDYLNCSADGVAVGVTAEGAYWPCLGARPALSPSVEYDTPVVHGEFTCVINFTTGARCTNGAGAGFTIEYSAGTTTF